MNHSDEWTQEQVDKFYRWVSEHPAFQAHVADEFPNLEGELRSWGLRREDADELAKFLKWLRILPYADQRVGRDILVFYYTDFRRLSLTLRDPRGKKLCALFPVLARMMFQGASIFPVQSAQLAEALMKCLRGWPTSSRDANGFEVLADLITDPVDGRFLHGHNADELTREQVNAVIESEHLRLAYNFEKIYETKEKYNGYKSRVSEDKGFRQDWDILKRGFSGGRISGNAVLRSKDNDWGRRKEIIRMSRSPKFQDVFDFFCWKWFLDGMKGDEPIVAKLSFDVNPFGTTIFIPGYWSFDPKRDIRWKELLEFHRSRGVKRQGEVFERKRRHRERLEETFLDAQEVSSALGDRGKELVERCKRLGDIEADTDDAYIYHVLREAKRKGIRLRPSPHQMALPLEEDSPTVAVPGQARTKATAKKARRTRRAKRTAK